MAETIRVRVATTYLRERADTARTSDDWPDVAMFESVAAELDDLRGLTNGRGAHRMRVASEVLDERARQDAKWGEQNHADGTGRYGGITAEAQAQMARRACDIAFKEGTGSWRHILLEEVYEALAETDPQQLRTELIQVAAVAVAWVEAIDRRGAGEGTADA